MHRSQRHRYKLSEGLRQGDLTYMISNRFMIDQYKSKMGDDETVIVISFKIKDKFPAIDAMEFLEKSYEFILDADISSGEESDGQYSLFVEIERSKKSPKEIKELLDGLSRLCDINDWRFRYYKDTGGHDFSEEKIEEIVPLTDDGYREKIKKYKIDDVAEVFNQGTTEVVDIDENDNITLNKPFAGELVLELEDIGEYQDLKSKLKGAIQLDEASNGEVLFLEKYLSVPEIYKIDNKFFIRNGDSAIIVSRKS